VRYCRRRALGITHRDGEPRPTIVALDRCKYCGKCARVCPSGAITLSPARAGHAETAATNAGILLIVAALVVAALVLLREGVEIFIT
jgi:ferredoxin